MPSGITSDIYEGKDISLRDYLMLVGRTMGYSIGQRDSSLREPVKTSLPAEDSYAVRRLRDLKRDRAAVAAMSEEDALTEARNKREASIKSRDESIANKKALRERYEAMLTQVKNWRPDPLMDTTKAQAIKYLEESIAYDCGKPGEEGRFWIVPDEPKSGKEYISNQLDHFDEMIARAEQDVASEKDRTNELNAYLDAFHKSLPIE